VRLAAMNRSSSSRANIRQGGLRPTSAVLFVGCCSRQALPLSAKWPPCVVPKRCYAPLPTVFAVSVTDVALPPGTGARARGRQ
jgi:hypothetical protein